MTIDEINRKGEISPRSYNICKFNNLNSVEDLKNYFFKYKSFKFLPNCGRKSNEELIEICNIYKSSNFESDEFKPFIEKYHFLQNIPTSKSLKMDHLKLYNQIAFE